MIGRTVASDQILHLDKDIKSMDPGVLYCLIIVLAIVRE